MTAIERTAYPRFKQNPTTKELAELYTPRLEEVDFVQSQVRSKSGLLSLIVMLKSFQRLGYFPHPEFVPVPVISHLPFMLKVALVGISNPLSTLPLSLPAGDSHLLGRSAL